MTQNEKFRFKRRVERRNLFSGIRCADWSVKLVFLLLYLAGFIWVWCKQGAIRSAGDNMVLLSPILKLVLENSMTTYLLLGGAVLVFLLVYPFGKKAAQDQLQSIGLVNHAGMVPVLLRKYRDKDNQHITVWEFRSQSVPLKTWEEKQAAIEAALDITVVKVKYGKGKSRILLYTVPAQTDLPERLEWKNSKLSQTDFELVLGEGFLGPVKVNLAHIPHILLGGSTGSGKSVLLKLLLMQAIRKGAIVCIADFKGGVDFPTVWHKNCRMCFEETNLLALLTELVDELERRKSLFRESGCPNISQYNKATSPALKRYIFACDEVAEVLDKTGLNKEQKELVSQIESKLAVIARQGRAFGIHLILATQRPDANILSGQIRNNIDCRVCGRADNVLSQIILDSTAAAEQIPKDARGRFLLHDGTVFQGYLFDEESL